MSGGAELGEHRAVAIARPCSARSIADAPGPRSASGAAEEMVRLDQLEPLVHHGRRIDRDLGAHAPVRMRDRLLRASRGAIASNGRVAERPAAKRSGRCGRPRRGAGLEDLEDGVVLAVDRQERRAVPLDLVHERRRRRPGTSLLARATMAPRRIAARVGARPAAPTIAAIDPFGRPPRRLDDRRGAGGCLDGAAGERRLERAVELRSAITASRAPRRRACAASSSTLRRAVSASTTKSSLWRSIRSIVLQPTEPVLPSTVTRRGCFAEAWSIIAMSARSRRRGWRRATRVTVSIPSRRSSRPPWPRWTARILDAEMPLGDRFRKIAGLRDDGERAAQQHERQDRDRGKKQPVTPPTAAAHATPPPRPAQVLLGLKRGARRGPPKVRPAAKAPMSVAHTTANIHTSWPTRRADRAQARSARSTAARSTACHSRPAAPRSRRGPHADCDAAEDDDGERRARQAEGRRDHAGDHDADHRGDDEPAAWARCGEPAPLPRHQPGTTTTMPTARAGRTRQRRGRRREHQRRDDALAQPGGSARRPAGAVDAVGVSASQRTRRIDDRDHGNPAPLSQGRSWRWATASR